MVAGGASRTWVRSGAGCEDDRDEYRSASAVVRNMNVLQTPWIQRTGDASPVEVAVERKARVIGERLRFRSGSTEPSKVAVGGTACQLRYQCTGCGFFRPNPSHILEIEKEVLKLRSQLRIAEGIRHRQLRRAARLITDYEKVLAHHARTTRAAPADQRAEIDTMSEVMRRARSAAGPARRVFRISRRDSSLGARQAGRLGGAGRARRECRRPETSERTCQISFANLSALSRRIEERLDTCHTSCQSMPCVARFIGTGRSPRVGPRTSAGESRQHSHRRLQT
jgi:hypothetical protein